MNDSPSDYAVGCGKGEVPFPCGWEPSLEALLDEPIVRALMMRDGVNEGELRALIRELARRHRAAAQHEEQGRTAPCPI